MATQRIAVTIGDNFKCERPVKTGPAMEVVNGKVFEIFPLAGKISIISEDERTCWVISIESYFQHNAVADRLDDC